jgi:hypothetical protein
MIAHITPTVMDGVVVRWTFDPRDGGPTDGEVSASRNGVLIRDLPLISAPTIRVEIEHAISAAWDCYRALAKDYERGWRMTSENVRAWLVGRGVRVVDVRLFETVAEALAREAQS